MAQALVFLGFELDAVGVEEHQTLILFLLGDGHIDYKVVATVFYFLPPADQIMDGSETLNLCFRIVTMLLVGN